MKYTAKTVKQAALMLALAAALTFITGCKNTAHGVGQDVERAGEKIQDKTE